jgi:hypothetical protein
MTRTSWNPSTWACPKCDPHPDWDAIFDERLQERANQVNDECPVEVNQRRHGHKPVQP